MNRRNFLKKIGVTCVVAVAAPAALVKAKPGINCNYPINWVGSEHPVKYGKMSFTMIKRKRPTKTYLQFSNADPYGPLGLNDMVLVDVIEDLKVGDPLIWYSNGSVGKAL